MSGVRSVGANTPRPIRQRMGRSKDGALSARTEELRARRVRGGHDADRGEGKEARKHHTWRHRLNLCIYPFRARGGSHGKVYEV